MKKFFYIFLLISTSLFPHSGRTDSKGGHTHSKTGKYHKHNSGSRSSVTEFFITLEANSLYLDSQYISENFDGYLLGLGYTGYLGGKYLNYGMSLTPVTLINDSDMLQSLKGFMMSIDLGSKFQISTKNILHYSLGFTINSYTYTLNNYYEGKIVNQNYTLKLGYQFNNRIIRIGYGGDNSLFISLGWISS